MLSEAQKDEEAMRIAADLFNHSMKHSDNMPYDIYKKFLDRINSQDEKFAVTCILKISMLIDSYTYQYPPIPKKDTTKNV